MPRTISFCLLKLGSGFLLSVLASFICSAIAVCLRTRWPFYRRPLAKLPEAPTPTLRRVQQTRRRARRPRRPRRTKVPRTQRPAQPKPPQAKAPQPGSSNSQSNPAAPAVDQKTKQQKADEQIKQQEHQRVLGIIPSFNTSYVSDAVSLTPKQKVSLAFRSAVDPYTFAIAFIVAGMGEADGGGPGFGWGPKGYFERSGAAYLDAFDGTMVGNAFLPIILHQDPRYFRLGHGSFHHRLFYAVATSFICKHDNTGKWEPNYSNVAGNIISGEISISIIRIPRNPTSRRHSNPGLP